MQKLNNIDDMKRLIKRNNMVLLYFSTVNCGICTTLLPKIDEMLLTYPNISAFHVSIDELPAASGEFSIFTVPSILVYIEGKEVIREARFISMDTLEDKIQKYYNMIF
ncbi:thioredoxin family protein [Thermoanaerobacterium sp. RBIITD]|uniref:thioredoxin family protein n=1 Tax=Thermoanaerobacterium sp. RBIITD TaxID=1550240 RepID=UPI000BB7F901|nr:thioredoxin family protein [Thermoanaerobacterium sp. RBIITD]